MDIEQIARDYADRAFADYLSDPRTGPALIEQAFEAGYATAREADLHTPLPSNAGGIRAEWDKSAGKYTFCSFGDAEAVKAIQCVFKVNLGPFPPNPTDVYDKPLPSGAGGKWDKFYSSGGHEATIQVGMFELMAKCSEISDQVAGEGVMADKRHAVLADMLLALQNRVEGIERVHAKDILNREKEYPNIMGMLDAINRAVVELTFAEPDAIEEKQDESGLKELWDAIPGSMRILHNGNIWEFHPDYPPRVRPAPTVDKEGNWRT